MEATDVAGAHARVAVVGYPDSPAGLDFIVHLLYISASQFRELDVPNPRHYMVLNVVLVIFLCTLSYVRFGISLVPRPHPATDGIFLGLLDVYLRTLPDGFLQLLLDLRLGSAKHVLSNRLPVLVMSSDIPTFPSTIRSLSYIPLAVGSAFAHAVCLLPALRQTHNIPSSSPNSQRKIVYKRIFFRHQWIRAPARKSIWRAPGLPGVQTNAMLASPNGRVFFSVRMTADFSVGIADKSVLTDRLKRAATSKPTA